MSESTFQIKTFTDMTFGENAFLLSVTNETDTKVGWVIDPGFPPQVRELLSYIEQQNIVLEKIILTHGHIDHIIGLDSVKQIHPQSRVLIGGPDAEMLGDAHKNMSAPFGNPLTVETQADGDLVPGEELSLGQLHWKILDTSGHSPGGRSLYCAEVGLVIVGDALFAGSVGRCDIPGANTEQLLNNIKNNLFSLPEDTVVYSGHGPSTSIGNERKSNPFISDA